MYEFNKKLLSGTIAVCLILSPVVAIAAQQQGVLSVSTSVLSVSSTPESVAVEAINNATEDEMEDVITANAKTLGLVLKDYQGLTDKSPVNIALVGKNFANKAAVKKAFDTAVATEKKVEANAVKNALIAINSATANGMGSAIIYYAETLGLDLTDYTNLESKSQVHKDLVGKRFATKAAVKKAFDAAVTKEKALEAAPAEEAKAVVAINMADEASMEAVITANATILGLVLTDYNGLLNKTPVHADLIGKSFADKTAVKDAFDVAVANEKAIEADAEAAAVEAINSAASEAMGEAIEANAEVLGLDLTDYNALKDKTPVHKALVTPKFKDKAAIKKVFDKAVAAQKKAEILAAEKAAVAAINNETLDKMGEAIAANATVLGLDLTDYNALKDKTPVHNALVTPIFKDKTAIKKAFDAAVAAQKKAEILAAEKAAVAAINNETLDKMGEAIEANAELLGLDLTDYNALKDKTPVHKALVTPIFKDKTAIKKAFDAAVATEKAAEEKAILEAEAVDAINSATLDTIGDVITENATILGLVLTDYNKLTDKEPVHEALFDKGFANKTEVKTAFDEAVADQKAFEASELKGALDAINNATLETMGEAIEANAELLGLDLTDYNALKDKTPVHKALVTPKFKDKAAIKKVFDKAVAAQKKAEILAAEKAAVAAINNETLDKMGEAIAANATVLGLDLTDYNALKDKTPVHNALVTPIFKDKAAVKKAFDVAVAAEMTAEANAIVNAALAAINNATVDTMGKAITDYATILGLDLTEYNDLKSKVSVHVAMVGNNFEDITGVQILFNYAVEAEKIAELKDKIMPEITEVVSIPGAVLDNTAATLSFPFSNLNRNSGIAVSEDSKMAVSIEGVGRIGDFVLKAGQTNSFLNTPFSTNLDLPDAELTKIFDAMKTLDTESKHQILEAVNLTELFTLIQKSDPVTINAVFQDIDFVNLFAAVQTAELETKDKIFDNMIGVLDLALAENNSAFKSSLISALIPVGTNKDLTIEQMQAIYSYLNGETPNINLKDLFRSFKLTKEQKDKILGHIDFPKVFDAVMSLQRTTRTNIFKAINFTELFNVVKNSSPTIRDQFYQDISRVIDSIVTSGIPRDKIFDTFSFEEVNKVAVFNLLNILDGDLTDSEVLMTATLTDAVGNKNTYTFHVRP